MYYYPYNAYIAQPQQPLWNFPWLRPTGNVIIETGSTLKNRTGRLRIQFTKNFTKPPIVIVTPYWQGQGSQVGNVETIDSVTRTGFTVVSNNAANNYYVNWIAIQQD